MKQKLLIFVLFLIASLIILGCRKAELLTPTKDSPTTTTIPMPSDTPGYQFPTPLPTSSSRPSYIEGISPQENSILPLKLYEANLLNNTDKEGLRSNDIGHNSSICLYMSDLSELVQSGDHFSNEDTFERITLKVNGRVLNEIGGVVKERIYEGPRSDVSWGGPLLPCWPAELDIGEHNIVFQFRQTSGDTKEYHWQFTITDENIVLATHTPEPR